MKGSPIFLLMMEVTTAADDDVHANIASHGTAVADCELCTCFVVQHKMRGSSVPTFLFQRNQRTED